MQLTTLLRGPRAHWSCTRGADRLPRDARAPGDAGRWLVARVRRPAARRAAALACAALPARGRRGLRRRPPHRCRPAGRPDFRQGAFRYGVTADPPAMMGGGALLARLRQRRLDRPLRGQLLRRGRHRRLRSDTLPRSVLFRNDHGHVSHEGLRGPADARRGLRRGRPERRRPHRPLRHERTERPAALERRRRQVHRGRPRRRGRLLRLALRRRRRGRERRRAARPVRLRLHGAAARDPGLAPPASRRTTSASATSSSSTSGTDARSARSASRSGSTRSRTTTRSAPSSPT